MSKNEKTPGAGTPEASTNERLDKERWELQALLNSAHLDRTELYSSKQIDDLIAAVNKLNIDTSIKRLNTGQRVSNVGQGQSHRGMYLHLTNAISSLNGHEIFGNLVHELSRYWSILANLVRFRPKN